jgi:hypothetical protein
MYRPILLLFSLLLCGQLSRLSAQALIGGSAGGWPGDVQISATLDKEIPLAKQWHLIFSPYYTRINAPALLEFIPLERDYYDLIFSYTGLEAGLGINLGEGSLIPFVQIRGFTGYGLRLQGNYQEGFNFTSERLNYQRLQLERWEAGLITSLGLKHRLSRGRLIFLALHYRHGISAVNQGQAPYFHRNLLFRAGIFIPLS